MFHWRVASASLIICVLYYIYRTTNIGFIANILANSTYLLYSKYNTYGEYENGSTVRAAID